MIRWLLATPLMIGRLMFYVSGLGGVVPVGSVVRNVAAEGRPPNPAIRNKSATPPLQPLRVFTATSQSAGCRFPPAIGTDMIISPCRWDVNAT